MIALVSVLAGVGSVGGQEYLPYRSRGPSSGGYVVTQRARLPAGTPRRANSSEPAPNDIPLRPASQAVADPPATPPQAKPADTAPAAAGEAAFNRYCTDCHDAQKSLKLKKTLHKATIWGESIWLMRPSGWMSRSG